MASGRIVIPVGLETRGVAKGAKDAEKSLKDLEDAVTDTGKDGARDLDKLEDELKDVQRQSDKTGRDVGRNMDDGFDKAKKGADDFKQEANSTAREAAASFDGSAESIGEAFQEVAANAFSGFGPAAGLAGLAVAAGIGAMTAEFTAMQEKAEETKQNIIDDFLELGDALDKEAVDARVRDLLGAKDTMAQAKLLADLLEITVGEAALAMAGDFESAGVTAEEVMEGIQDASGNVDLKTWQDLKGTINATTEGMKAGKEAADAQAAAQRRTAETTKRSQQEQRDAVAKTREELQAMARGTYVAEVEVRVNDSAWRNWRPDLKYGTVIGSPTLGGRTPV